MTGRQRWQAGRTARRLLIGGRIVGRIRTGKWERREMRHSRWGGIRNDGERIQQQGEVRIPTTCVGIRGLAQGIGRHRRWRPPETDRAWIGAVTGERGGQRLGQVEGIAHVERGHEVSAPLAGSRDQLSYDAGQPEEADGSATAPLAPGGRPPARGSHGQALVAEIPSGSPPFTAHALAPQPESL